jgi:hypothetical protein
MEKNRVTDTETRAALLQRLIQNIKNAVNKGCAKPAGFRVGKYYLKIY